MRIIKRVVVLSFFGGWLLGCSTVPIAMGPDVYSLAKLEGAPVVAVPKVVDNRSDQERLGTIGVASFSSQADIPQSLTNRLLFALHERGFNVARISSVDPQEGSQIKEQLNANSAQGLLYVSLEEVHLFSIDSLLQPTTVDVTLHALLFDNNGRILFDHRVSSSASKRLGLATKGSVSELVEQAIEQSVGDLLSHEALKQNLKKI